MSSQTIVFPDSSRHDDRYDQRPDSPRCTEMIIYITGGAHGIGAATASLAAASGHDVVLLDRDGAAAERHATGLSDLGVKALGLRCDVADEGQVVRAFAEARQLVGQPRGLVTSAGIDRGGSRARGRVKYLGRGDRRELARDLSHLPGGVEGDAYRQRRHRLRRVSLRARVGARRRCLQLVEGGRMCPCAQSGRRLCGSRDQGQCPAPRAD